MRFDWLTFGFQLVNFIVLLAILRRFLFRPLVEIISKRQAQTLAAMTKAEAARVEAEKATQAAKGQLDAAEGLRRGALEAARAEAEAQGKRLLAEAREAAMGILAEAREQAQQTARRAERDTLNHVRDLAETIARKALSALPDPPTVEGFARKLTDALAALPRERREGLLAGGGPRLVAARALSEDEMEGARALLRPLGLEGLNFAVDPSLIVGLELFTDTGVLRNSLAHDLNLISQALGHDDAAGV